MSGLFNKKSSSTVALFKKKSSSTVAISNSTLTSFELASLEELQRTENDDESIQDDRDDVRYHLAGIKLYTIVFALCVSVILVALVCKYSE